MSDLALAARNPVWQRHGIHGWNCLSDDWIADPEYPFAPRGWDAAWSMVQQSGASWFKGLPEHLPDRNGRCALAEARSRGLRTVLRLGKGDSEHLHWEDVHQAITKYGSLIDVIECGNEPHPPYASPTPTQGAIDWWWDHIWYLNQMITKCLPLAVSRGIALMSPGYRAEDIPPRTQDGFPSALVNSWRKCYKQFSSIGVHVYDAHRLTGQNVWDHIDAWNELCFDTWRTDRWQRRSLSFSEIGIAAALLANQADKPTSDIEKARRLHDFEQQATVRYPHTLLFSVFILGGTRTFARFNDGSDYVPAGVNSYWLTPTAWHLLGDLMRLS